jgi:IS5 family transposase
MQNKKSRGFFDEEMRLDKLTKQKDPLVKLQSHIDFEHFRPLLTEVFKKDPKGAGGAPPFDYVMMFKILVLQKFYNLSDDKTEFHILDRMSFMRFLGLALCDKVPDSKTIWHFREELTKAGVIEKLFIQINELLVKKGVLVNNGSMIDASFVEVPRQRNSRGENKEIKNGDTPEKWKLNPHKLSQKDVDARWTKKNNVSFYGYKNHVKADVKTKFVEKYAVTDASVHDSQTVDALLDETDIGQELYADSAYTGEVIEKILDKKNVQAQINEKGYRNKPLTDQQKQNNRIKSKTRARVEHIFGFVENSMNGSVIRTIGKARAEAQIGLMNLTYNLFRCIQLNVIL